MWSGTGGRAGEAGEKRKNIAQNWGGEEARTSTQKRRKLSRGGVRSLPFVPCSFDKSKRSIFHVMFWLPKQVLRSYAWGLLQQKMSCRHVYTLYSCDNASSIFAEKVSIGSCSCVERADSTDCT